MRVRSLCDALGVEVLDVDLRQPQPDDVRDDIVAAWREHQLVLLRHQQLTADEQVAFARWFGVIRPPDGLVHPDLGADATHSHLSNTRPDGTGRIAEVMRHQDFTWTVPLRGLCLYAIEVPSDGGDTVFYNAEGALRRLDIYTRRRVDGVRAVHFDRFAGNRDHRAAAPLEAEHPVVLTHPETGRPILFVNEQTTRCLRDDGGECSEELLARLLAVFDAPELQYVHRWDAGDLIVWDNLSVQHSRKAFPSDQPRTLRRVQID